MAGTSPATSVSASNTDVPSPSVSRQSRDVSVTPRNSAILDQSVTPPNSVRKTTPLNTSAGEVSFANLAQQLFLPKSPDHRTLFSNKPSSVDVGIQVNPMDLSHGLVGADLGRAEIGIQAREDELLASVSADGGSLSGRCCPYCHSRLPATDVASTNDAEMHPSDFVVVSSVPTESNSTRLMSSPSGCVTASLSTPAVTSPASVSSFVPCSLSLGDSFHYSPMRNMSSLATAPIRIYPLGGVTSSDHVEVAAPVPALSVPACSLPINTSLTDSELVAADTDGQQNVLPMHSDGRTSLPNANSQSSAETSLISTPVVTFSVAQEAARLPMSAESGGQLSNTSLSNITLSDLLPSMQGSIPLELLVNQSDGFAMYTEIVAVSEPCQVDPLSMNLPGSGSSSSGAGVSELAVSQQSWSPTGLLSQQSPVNVMVCLPLSSVSSPSLSSFLSQHKSLSSFTADAAICRPPTPIMLAPDDTIETVAVAVVPPVNDGASKPAENYSIHRIVETSALKRVRDVADCSWSSSNTGVLISRQDIAANSAALSDFSVAEEDRGQTLDDDRHGNVDNSCHVDNSYHGNGSFHGDDSCRGDDSDTHDDICVIDSDRDVIVIDGDDEVVQPNVGSDAAALVPERTGKVGRHGRRRRQKATKSSIADRASRHAATGSVTVEVDGSDHSRLMNCLDNGFVEMSPCAAITANTEQPLTCRQVIS